MGKGIFHLSDQKASQVVFIISKFFSSAFFLFVCLLLYNGKKAARSVYASFVLVMNSSFILRMCQDGTVKIKYI